MAEKNIFICLYVNKICVDSDGEAPKKKPKATPPKQQLGKKGKSSTPKKGKSSTPAVKKEIKSVSDFFGSTPIRRSQSSSKEDKKEVLCTLFST